jgi:hypothetical protein
VTFTGGPKQIYLDDAGKNLCGTIANVGKDIVGMSLETAAQVSNSVTAEPGNVAGLCRTAATKAFVTCLSQDKPCTVVFRIDQAD